MPVLSTMNWEMNLKVDLLIIRWDLSFNQWDPHAVVEGLGGDTLDLVWLSKRLTILNYESHEKYIYHVMVVGDS